MAAKGVEKVDQVGADGKKVTIEKPIAPYSASDLIRLRQSYRAQQGDYLRGDVNRRILSGMIGKVDDMLTDMASNSGKPEAIEQLKAARAKYADAREVLDSNTADKLKLTDPDKALENINNYLLTGRNAPAKIATFRRVIGNDKMPAFSQSYIQGLQDMAAEDPNKALKAIDKLTPPVRAAFFDPDVDTQLQKAAEVYRQSVQYAEDRAANQTSAFGEGLENDRAAINAQADFQKGAATEAHGDELSSINDRAQQAIDEANQLHQSSVEGLSRGQAIANEPFRSSFINDLMTGDVNEKLAKGDVKLSDVNDIKNAIGGQRWDDITQGIFQRAVKDTMTAGQPNPAKLFKWWDDIDPAVRDQMFSPNTARGAALQDFMANQVKDARTQQNLIKAGLAVPLVGGAGTGIALLPQTMLYHFLEGAAAGAGLAKYKLLNSILNYVSNRPAMWAILSALSKPAGSALGKALGPAAAGLTGQSASYLNSNSGLQQRVYSQGATGLQ
jgi:hypothetical protein